MNRLCAETVDEARVHGDVETIFRMAAEVSNWPKILPHYRWVSDLGQQDGCKKVEMAARRGWIPVKWTALQTVTPGVHSIHYTHICGATRGMKVEWKLEDDGDCVRVTIVHELTLTTPIVRSLIGRWIVGGFFVHHIAQRTLRRIKDLAEQEGRRSCGEQL